MPNHPKPAANQPAMFSHVLRNQRALPGLDCSKAEMG